MTIRAFALEALSYEIITEIPFTELEVTNTLNGIGSWSMKLPTTFTSPDGVEVLTEDNFSTNRSLVAIVDDYVPIMMGLFHEEDGEFDEVTEQVSVGGPEAALGYLEHRPWQFLSTTFTATEQLYIAETLIDAGTSSGIGSTSGLLSPIEVTRVPTNSGRVRDRTFSIFDRKYLYEYLDELANVEDGFEYTSYLAGDQMSGFYPGIVLGYPNLLRKTNRVLELGKNVVRVSRTRSGENLANVVYVMGAKAKGNVTPFGAAGDASSLDTYPAYFNMVSKTDVIEQQTLQDHADRILARHRVPPNRFEVTLDPDDPECQIGTFRAGDEFRFIAQRGRLSVDSLFRVESWSYGVNADGVRSLTMSLFETGTI